MFKNTLSKFVLTVVVLVWALSSLFPIKDTPFAEYMAGRATAEPLGYQEIYERAVGMVEREESASLFLALTEIGKREKIDYSVYFPDVNLADIKNLEKRNDILLRHLLISSQGKMKLGLDLKGGVAFTLKVDDASLLGKESFQKQQQLSKAIDIMERRVNGLGVAEPLIRARGDSAIEVQLPGLTTQENPDALASLKKPAKLTFHRVHRTLTPDNTPESEYPIGYMPMNMEMTDPRTGKVFTQSFFLKKIPAMGGSMVKNAFPHMNEFHGGFEIILKMTSDGAKRFEALTGEIADENGLPQYSSLPAGHPAKKGKLAIVLDGQLYSAPQVSERIPSGSAVISGQFTRRDAIELSNVLNNPLEFELKLEEMYEVGPTLADDTRKTSINAALLGAGLVIAFMVLYYLSAGLVAVISVLINILIVIGVMASLGSTLTLPGVAALVLTIGIAVDSNILIFERIREELKAGKGLAGSVASGYEKAFSTILDANVTTLLTALILIWLGTGPVKGFGVTLSIGIGATLFCALIVSKMLLEFLVNRNILKSILNITLFKESKFDFLGKRRPAFITSWVIVILGTVSLIYNYDHIYGIDFMGGDEVSIHFNEKIPTQDIYTIAEDLNLGEVVPTYQTLLSSENNAEILKIQTEIGQADKVFGALSKAYPGAELEVLGVNTIGASVSDTIKTDALLAILVALVGILLYVALRFELGYGIGAVVSTIHDVLLSIGIFVLLGGQFTAPMVAAVLMIVGYSINDTIVVFDRIREELELNPTASLRNIVNIAINKTLSRTMLTSVTTLMAALALYIFGAGVVNDFALVFIIGIITGTFSSVFIAAPIFYWWHKGDRKHVEAGEFKPKYEWDADYSSSEKKAS